MQIPSAEVWLDFMGPHFPAKKQAPEFADAVLGMIAEHMPHPKGMKTISREELWQHPVLGPHLNSFNLFRWTGLDRPFVTASRGTFLPPLTHSLLQNVLSRKNARVTDYKLQCDKIWLVVANHSSELASRFAPHEAALYDEYDVDFDRAFVLDVLGKRVVEIRKLKEVV
jgi:hypothetical protein